RTRAGPPPAAARGRTGTAPPILVQAGPDAGHHFNQARGDAGAGGAAPQCASKDVPASKLAITKTATETSYSAVGQTIHYQIVATNTGNTTLTNVTVLDAAATGLRCTPPNRSSPAPPAPPDRTST